MDFNVGLLLVDNSLFFRDFISQPSLYYAPRIAVCKRQKRPQLRSVFRFFFLSKLPFGCSVPYYRTWEQLRSCCRLTTNPRGRISGDDPLLVNTQWVDAEDPPQGTEQTAGRFRVPARQARFAPGRRPQPCAGVLAAGSIEQPCRRERMLCESGGCSFQRRDLANRP